jgi:hypothetical protein
MLTDGIRAYRLLQIQKMGVWSVASRTHITSPHYLPHDRWHRCLSRHFPRICEAGGWTGTKGSLCDSIISNGLRQRWSSGLPDVDSVGSAKGRCLNINLALLTIHAACSSYVRPHGQCVLTTCTIPLVTLYWITYSLVFKIAGAFTGYVCILAVYCIPRINMF